MMDKRFPCYFTLIFMSFFIVITRAEKKDIHIANLMPYSGAWKNGYPCEAVIGMALEDVENAHILPNHKLVLHTRDDKCSSGLSVFRMHELLYKKPTKLLLLGPGCSHCCVATAEAAVYWNITQTTFACATPVVSDKKKYPLFMRVNTVDMQTNLLRIEILKKYNWRKFAIIHTTQDLFPSVVRDLIGKAREDNMTVLTSETLTGDFNFTLERIKESEARIIFLFSYMTDGLNLFCAAYRNGLYGGRYMFIIPSWWDMRGFNDIPKGVNCPASMIHRVTHYTLITGPLYDNPNKDAMTEYGFTYADYKARFDKLVIRGEGTNVANLQCYDVIWSIAFGIRKAMQRMEKEGWNRTIDDFTYKDREISKLLWDEMTSLNYLGVRGPVAFLENGDAQGLFKFRQLLLENVSDAAGTKEMMIPKDLTVFNPLAPEGEQFVYMSTPQWRSGRPPKDSIVTVRTVLRVSLSTYIPICILGTLGLFSTFFFVTFNIYHRNKRFIKMSSPNMNNVALAGCTLMYLSVIFADLGPSVPQMVFCKIRSILASIGFSLAFGSLFSKTYRVHRIFLNKKLQRRIVLDRHLLGIVGVIVMVDICVFTLWEIIDARNVHLHVVHTKVIDEDTEEQVKLTKCDSEYYIYFSAVLYGIKGILLIFGAFLSWETRKVNVPELNDSKNIGLCIYNVIVVSLLAVGMGLALDNNPEVAYIVNSLCTIFATTFTTCMIFVPKVLGIWGGKIGVDQLNEGSIGTIHGAVGESSTNNESKT